MGIHIFGIAAFFFIYSVFPALSLASTCFISGSGKGLLVNGEEEAFGIIENCNEVELKEGEADVCYKDSIDANRCVHLKVGDKIALDNPGDLFSGFSLASLDQILRPSSSTPGGRRLDDEASIPGFPAGEILLPVDKLVFSVYSSAVPQGLSVFSLYTKEDDSNPVYEIQSPGSSLEIPANKLEYGKTYRWIARSSGGSSDDLFRIANQEDQADFEKQLAELVRENKGSPRAEDILKAELCHEFEYYFDRDQALRKVYASNP
ncbi:MAG: hypothetical protein ACRERV_01300 [Methylococcales bacterium]